MKFDLLQTRSAYLRTGIIFFLLLVYILLPSNNSTTDAIGYAGDAKWGSELFSPHHLLYTAHLYLISKISGIYNTLFLGKYLNAIYAVFSLLVLGKVLDVLKQDRDLSNSLIFFTGSTFALMRFATENETYIIPVFFSLAGSYFFLDYYKNDRKTSYILLSGFLLALACLFHQIHFFWWLALLISIPVLSNSQKLKVVFFYVLPAILVPITYIIVIVFYLKLPLTFYNITHFIFYTFNEGTANVSLSLMGIARFIISIFRSFFQVHGSMLFVIRENNLYVIPGVFLIITAIFFIRKIKFKRPNLQITNKLLLPFIFALILHLLFALISFGNAEFMVMVPFLVVIIISSFIQNFNINRIWAFSFIMLLWNVTYGLIPYRFFQFNNTEKWAGYAWSKKEDCLCLKNGVEINNMVYYTRGKYLESCYDPDATNSLFLKRFKKCMEAKKEIYTNSLNPSPIINTASIISDKENHKFFLKFKPEKVDSIIFPDRKEYIYKLNYK